MRSTIQEAAAKVHETEKQRQVHQAAKRNALAIGKPTLTADEVVEFLNWITVHVVGDQMSHAEATLLMRAAELAISTRHADAQDKVTQHTLVDQGVIAPPPNASQSA